MKVVVARVVTELSEIKTMVSRLRKHGGHGDLIVVKTSGEAAGGDDAGDDAGDGGGDGAAHHGVRRPLSDVPHEHRDRRARGDRLEGVSK